MVASGTLYSRELEIRRCTLRLYLPLFVYIFRFRKRSPSLIFLTFVLQYSKVSCNTLKVFYVNPKKFCSLTWDQPLNHLALA